MSRLLSAMIAGLLLASPVLASPFAIVDLKPSSFGVIGGASFGPDRLQGGFAVSAYHAYQMTPFKPDVEVDAMLAVAASKQLTLIGFLGVSALFADKVVWSPAFTLVVTQPKPIAFRGSVFVMWTPSDGSVFVQARAGVSLSVTKHVTIFPHFLLTMPDARSPTTLTAGPGVTAMYFF